MPTFEWPRTEKVYMSMLKQEIFLTISESKEQQRKNLLVSNLFLFTVLLKSKILWVLSEKPDIWRKNFVMFDGENHYSVIMATFLMCGTQQLTHVL